MLYLLGEQDPGIPFTVMRDEIAILKAGPKSVGHTFRKALIISGKTAMGGTL